MITKENIIEKIGSRFAFYGTLRKNQGNHRWSVAKDVGAKFDGTHVIPGYKMFSLGVYPFIVSSNSGDDSIVVELYELTDPEIISSIHWMEIGAGYHVEEIVVNDKSYNLYVQEPRYRKYEEVPGGDWIRYIGQR